MKRFELDLLKELCYLEMFHFSLFSFSTTNIFCLYLFFLRTFKYFQNIKSLAPKVLGELL